MKGHSILFQVKYRVKFQSYEWLLVAFVVLRYNDRGNDKHFFVSKMIVGLRR